MLSNGYFDEGLARISSILAICERFDVNRKIGKPVPPANLVDKSTVLQVDKSEV